MDMIQTDKLVFEYDKRDEDGNIIGKSRAIDEVDIDVKEAQFIAILGHNGSGKSTFAKHINALLVPTDGTMWVDGRDTKDPNELWNVDRVRAWFFRIQTIRLSERSWRKMLDLAQRIWAYQPTKSGNV